MTPPSLHIELDAPPVASLAQQQQRPHSLAPSPRRERPPLRSSPLAGPSYASDGAGGIIEQESALENEIARRKSMLVAGLDDGELARLAALSHSPAPSLSVSVADKDITPQPSRQSSSDSSTGDGHEVPKRKARPSFISLAPPTSPTSPSPNLLPVPPQTLRNRHSSPNMVRAVSLDTARSPPLPATPSSDKATANWMTSTPAPSFSRSSIHTRGVILPVKADSKSGKRIRRKSMPYASTSHLRQPQAPVPPLPVPGQIRMAAETDMDIECRGQGQPIRLKKSARSIRSFFRHEHEDKEKDKPPVPAPVVAPSAHSRSRASSVSGVSVQMPPTPTDNAVVLSIPSPAQILPDDHPEPGKVKRLWSRVKSGIKKLK